MGAAETLDRQEKGSFDPKARVVCCVEIGPRSTDAADRIGGPLGLWATQAGPREALGTAATEAGRRPRWQAMQISGRD